MSDWQALAEALGRRFVVVEQSVEIGDARFAFVKPRSPDELISEEDFNRDERLPYWADVWPSALCLAEQILSATDQTGSRSEKIDVSRPIFPPQRSDFRVLSPALKLLPGGHAMLELGCGVGCVCAAAAARGWQVVATDYYREALEFTEVNLARNGLPRPTTRLVDWRSFPADLGTFDLVVAADVLYEKAYPSLVASAVEKSLAPGGLALIADPGRRGAVPFQQECHDRGLQIHHRARAPYHNGSVQHTVDLYEIRRGEAP